MTDQPIPIDPAPPADAPLPSDPVLAVSVAADVEAGVAFQDNSGSDSAATPQFTAAPAQNGHIVEQRGFGRQTADNPMTITQIFGGQ